MFDVSVSNMQFYVEHSIATMGYSLHFLGKSTNNDEKLMYACPVTVKTEDMWLQTDPMLYVKEPQLQKLMNDLWNLGFRPNTYKEDKGALSQAKEHIKDLRAIAYHSLGIKE